MGSTGKGKTTLMRKEEKASKSKTKYFIHVLDIQMMLLKKDGLDKLSEILKWEELYIDDLGKEPTIVKFFGSELMMMQYILEKRYDMQFIPNYGNHSYKTFFTTNLSFKELEDKYGPASARRIAELADVIEL